MAGTARLPNSWVWIPTRWLGDGRNFSVSRSNEAEHGKKERDAHRRKKNANGNRTNCPTAPALQGPRPRARSEIDAQKDPEHPPTTPETGYSQSAQYPG